MARAEGADPQLSQREEKTDMFRSLPSLAIVVVAYNIVALLTGPSLGTAVVNATLPSGAAWSLTVGELIILAGIALLFLEIVKASRSRAAGSITRCL